MVFLLLLFCFTVVPIVELYLLIQAGSMFGTLNTLAIVLFTGVFGAYFSKLEGRNIWMQLQRQMKQSVLPADTMLSGAMVFVGGILLITPGFLTDFFGLSLVFPWTRAIYLSALKVKIARMIEKGTIRVYNANQAGPGFGRDPFGADPFRDEPRDVTPRGPADVIDISTRQKRDGESESPN